MIRSAASFASSATPGPDCGVGAALAGDDTAGKVTLGADATTCTITFSAPFGNAPACTAMNETNGGLSPVLVGAKTTAATLQLNSLSAWASGDVISYICQGY
jgi:hypothetical protein